MNNKKKIFTMKRVAIVLIILGVLFTFAKLIIKAEIKELMEKGIEVEASVKECKMPGQKGGYWTYPIIVSYTDLRGQIHEGETYARYEIKQGDNITIYYNEDNPESISVDPYLEYDEHSLMAGIVIGAVGIILLIIHYYKKQHTESRENIEYISETILCILLISLGIFGLFWQFYGQEVQLDNFRKNAVETTGTIIRYYKDKNEIDAGDVYVDNPTAPKYVIIFKYTTLDGKQYESSVRTYSEPTENVYTIYYNKNKPYQIKLSLTIDTEQPILIGALLGCSSIGIGCFILILMYSKYKRKQKNNNI